MCLDCKICGKLFKFQSSLSRHGRTHKGLKVECECGAMFSRRENLKRHQCKCCNNTIQVPITQNSSIPDNRNSILSKLAFEQIKDNYWYATYGPFRVVMDRSNGYINVTKLCSAEGKNYCDWSRLKGNNQLITLLQYRLQLQNSNVTLPDGDQQICGLPSSTSISVKTGNNTPTDQVISGTYCHPELIPHIAFWISPEFALSISIVINEYIVQEYK
jgi:KilA-N domain/Zinc finger, C2H2 type